MRADMAVDLPSTLRRLQDATIPAKERVAFANHMVQAFLTQDWERVCPLDDVLQWCAISLAYHSFAPSTWEQPPPAHVLHRCPSRLFPCSALPSVPPNDIHSEMRPHLLLYGHRSLLSEPTLFHA